MPYYYKIENASMKITIVAMVSQIAKEIVKIIIAPAISRYNTPLSNLLINFLESRANSSVSSASEVDAIKSLEMWNVFVDNASF